MRPNNIDEIMKKALKEAEKKNARLANVSRSKVWHAIEKPEKSSFLHWGLVTALAAAVTLFLVSVFLMLKLESKQQELDVLQTQILREMPSNEYTIVPPFNEGTAAIGFENQSEALPEPIPAPKKLQLPPLVPDPGIAKMVIEEVENGNPDPLRKIQPISSNFLPEMVPPELDLPELKREPVWSGTAENTIPSEIKTENRAKLKIRIGNGNSAPGQHQSLALNLKL